MFNQHYVLIPRLHISDWSVGPASNPMGPDIWRRENFNQYLSSRFIHSRIFTIAILHWKYLQMSCSLLGLTIQLVWSVDNVLGVDVSTGIQEWSLTPGFEAGQTMSQWWATTQAAIWEASGSGRQVLGAWELFTKRKVFPLDKLSSEVDRKIPREEKCHSQKVYFSSMAICVGKFSYHILYSYNLSKLQNLL